MFNFNCQISLNLKLDKLNPIYYNGVYPGNATPCKEVFVDNYNWSSSEKFTTARSKQHWFLKTKQNRIEFYEFSA